MRGPSLLEAARVARGLTQEAAARRAGTSQPTLSAYERGARSPTLIVAERILRSLGFDLTVTPHVTFRIEHDDNSRAFVVPDQLWRLAPRSCFTPFRVKTSVGVKTYDVADRADRVTAYAWLIQHGNETQLIEHLDSALLADAWSEIAGHLPERIREPWANLVQDTRDGWFIDSLRTGMRAAHSKKVSPAARKRAIKRLVEYGLSADQIRAVLQRRR